MASRFRDRALLNRRIQRQPDDPGPAPAPPPRRCPFMKWLRRLIGR